MREAEECNRGLSEQLAQAEQNTAVFQAQVLELKEVIRRKDEQVVAGKVAAAKVASLEAEVEKLTQALAELEVSWKAKCERAAGAWQKLFREGEVYKQQLKGAYNKGQDDLSRLGY